MSLSVILFGAGASHGCGMPHPPPLGRDLFHHLAAEFPGTWGKLPETAKSLFRENFEQGMTHAADSMLAEDVFPLVRDIALYFCRFRASEGNHYRRLVSGLRSSEKLPHVKFSTLNYDCLLDAEIPRLAYSDTWGAKYELGTASSTVNTLWKLHGSCNFVVDLGSNQITVRTLGVAGRRQIIDGQIQVIPIHQVAAWCQTHPDKLPVVANYAPGKHSYMCMSHLKRLQVEWSETIAVADKVAVVGVGVNLQDAHIWEPLIQTDAPLLYVGSTTDYARISGIRKGETRFVGSTFGESVHALVEALPPLRTPD